MRCLDENGRDLTYKDPVQQKSRARKREHGKDADMNGALHGKSASTVAFQPS